MLSISDQPIPTFEPFKVDPELAARGREQFGMLGYPQGINLAFDSEQMSLRLLWKGEFANVDLGSFEPRGTERISLPPGIPFHRLKSLDDNWPYKGKAYYTVNEIPKE